MRYLVEHGRRGYGPSNGRAASQERGPDRHAVGEIVYQVADDDVPAHRLKALDVCQRLAPPRIHESLEALRALVRGKWLRSGPIHELCARHGWIISDLASWGWR